MTLIGSIVVGVSANTSKLQEGLRQGSSAVQSFSSSLAAAAGPAAPVVKLIGMTAEAGVAAATAFAKLTSSAAEAIDKLGAMAQQFGIGSVALREFQAVASVSDTSLDSVGKGLKKMESAIVKAARSAKEDNPFATIGLSARELSGMAPEKAFVEVAKAVAALPGPMERVAAAQAIFGKGGSELIPMLMELAGGAGSARERLSLLWAQFTESGVQGVKSAKDAFDEFKTSLSIAFEVAAIKLAPAMELLIETVHGFLSNQSGQQELLNFFEAVYMGIEGVVHGFSKAREWAGYFQSGLKEIVATFHDVMAANPFGSDEGRAQHEEAAAQARAAGAEIATAALEANEQAAKSISQRLDDIHRKNNAKARAAAEMRKVGGEVEPTEKRKVKDRHGDRLAKFMGEGAKLFEDSLRPAEKYERQIKKLHGLWSLGAISQTTWARSMGKARKEFDEETAKGTKKQRDEADKLKEAVKTPLEEYQDEVARVRKLREGGFIDDKTAKRGIDKAGRDLLEKGNKADKGSTELAVLEFGSKEAFSAILNSNKPMDRLAQIAEMQLKVLERMEAGIQDSRVGKDEVFDQV